MKKSLLHICLLLGVASLMQGCITDDYNGPNPNLPSRTVLVYLGGDNSLSASLETEVEELRKGWTRTGNRCLIYIDPVDDTPRLLSLRGGCQSCPIPYIDTLAVYPEENSASAEVFGRVIAEVVKRQPADSYGLIFASHGSGWLPEGTLAKPLRSIGIDTHTATDAVSAEMELADFAAAIPDGQFDFIIFESCLMAGVEVAYELRNKADYMLASSAELLSPGFVPIYSTSQRPLFDTSLTTEHSLQRFAQSYYDYMDVKSGAFRSATLSIIKLDEMNALAAMTKEVLTNAGTQVTPNTISSIQHFDRPGRYGDYPVSPRYFDLLEFLLTVVDPNRQQSIIEQVERAVVWKAATPTFLDGQSGFAITTHSGLTTYIEQDCFSALNTSYRQTAWYNATH